MNGQPQNPTENVDKEFELELAERQSWIEMYEALQRLEENKDFKKIILERSLKMTSLKMKWKLKKKLGSLKMGWKPTKKTKAKSKKKSMKK
jgi:hypothetical protein